MIFLAMLLFAAVLGACIGGVLSWVPGRRGSPLGTGLLLLPLSALLFAGGLCLASGSRDPVRICDSFFPDRLSKLLGCALCLLLAVALGLLAGICRAGSARAYFRRAAASKAHRWVGRGLLGGGLAAVALCAVLVGGRQSSPVVLSEVCCCNFSLQNPDTGEFDPYIELHNTSDTSVNLAGYFLSDRGRKRNLHCLPQLTLAPDAYLILWADGTGTSAAKGGTGTSLCFSLKPGETLFFSSPGGSLIDSVTLPQEEEKNIGMVKMDEGWMQATVSPAQANDGAVPWFPATLEEPAFDHLGGFYPDSLTLRICAAEDCDIRYTLDGSEPTADSPLYREPLHLSDRSAEPNQVVSQKNTTELRDNYVTEPVRKGTVVRAAAFRSDGQHSRTVTQSYFVGDFSEYSNAAVLSLTVDPADLFSDYGICVTGKAYDDWFDAGGNGSKPTPNFLRHGRSWERDAVLQLFDPQRQCVLDQVCGVRVQGNTSRTYSFKRLAFYARPNYSGSSVFDVPLFSGFPSHSINTREGLLYGTNQAYDVVVQQLLADRDLGTLNAMEVYLFVNGEFYLKTYLYERYDKQYFASHYGIPEEDLALISDHTLDCGTDADYQDYLDLLDFIQHNDTTDPAVWAEINARLDVQSFIDYLCANFYCNNVDWCFEKNCKLWRSRSGGGSGSADGRWRMLAYDMDAVGWSGESLGLAPAEVNPFLRPIPVYRGAGDRPTYLEMPVVAQLLENPEFRRQFILSYQDLMNVNFCPAQATPVLERLHLTEHWLWPTFLRERPAYALRNLTQALALDPETAQLTLSVSDPAGGRIRLNTVWPDLSTGQWSGTYLCAVPVTVTAEPAPGWRFAGWQGALEWAESSVSLPLSASGTALKAVFVRDEKGG